MPAGNPRTGEVWLTADQQCRVYRDDDRVVVFHNTNPDPMRTPLEAFLYAARYSDMVNAPCNLFGPITSDTVQRDRSYAAYALARLEGATTRDVDVPGIATMLIGLITNPPTDLIYVDRRRWAFLQEIIAEFSLDRSIMQFFRIDASPSNAVQHPEDVRMPVSARILSALIEASQGLPDGEFSNALSPAYRAAWRQAEALQRELDTRQEAPTLWERLDET